MKVFREVWANPSANQAQFSPQGGRGTSVGGLQGLESGEVNGGAQLIGTLRASCFIPPAGKILPVLTAKYFLMER